jgi:hypothetical protein
VDLESFSFYAAEYSLGNFIAMGVLKKVTGIGNQMER